MKIIKLDSDNYLFYNGETNEATKYCLSELREQVSALQTVLPDDISKDDAKLLAWAKMNYPMSLDAQGRQTVLDKISELSIVIDQIGGI